MPKNKRKRRTPPVQWLVKYSRRVLVAVALFAIIFSFKQSSRNSFPPFVVVDIPGKGKGVIATRDIQQGELLIREKPLFIVPSSITISPITLLSQLLPTLHPRERDALFNLSYVHLPNDLSREDPTYEARLALAITQTNAISLGDKGIGLFPTVSRLNHGCSSAFNSVYSWRERERMLVVYALKYIQKGDELLTTYMDTKRPRDERRAYLLENYGFNCSCSVCSLPAKLSTRSDMRLSKMTELHQYLSRWTSAEIDGPEAISIINTIWNIGAEEGYISERGRLAADGGWVAAAHSDLEATRKWAVAAISWYGYELGKDSELVNEMTEIARNPASHPSWGTRRPAAVGGPW